MKSRSLTVVIAIAAVGTVGLVGAAVVMPPPDSHGSEQKSRHVLLVSVDGMHQQDLDWYVKLALLVRNTTSYTGDMAAVPTDSFPGLIVQVTGGPPGITGIYYDDIYYFLSREETFGPGVIPADVGVPLRPVEYGLGPRVGVENSLGWSVAPQVGHDSRVPLNLTRVSTTRRPFLAKFNPSPWPTTSPSPTKKAPTPPKNVVFCWRVPLPRH